MDNDLRLQAMCWWNELPNTEKSNLTEKWYDIRFHYTLTGREIEKIYNGEKQLNDVGGH